MYSKLPSARRSEKRHVKVHLKNTFLLLVVGALPALSPRRARISSSFRPSSDPFEPPARHGSEAAAPPSAGMVRVGRIAQSRGCHSMNDEDDVVTSWQPLAWLRRRRTASHTFRLSGSERYRVAFRARGVGEGPALLSALAS